LKHGLLYLNVWFGVNSDSHLVYSGHKLLQFKISFSLISAYLPNDILPIT